MSRKRDTHSVLKNPSTPPSSDIVESSHDKNASDSNSNCDYSYKKKGKKRRKNKDNSSQGRWTDFEHQQFVDGKWFNQMVYDIFALHNLSVMILS